jgi:ATP phosphoribosyltransferase
VHVDLIRLYGSMELAPLTGLAGCDRRSRRDGRTLKANHLVAGGRNHAGVGALIVNQAALKTKRTQLQELIGALEKAAQR